MKTYPRPLPETCNPENFSVCSLGTPGPVRCPCRVVIQCPRYGGFDSYFWDVKQAQEVARSYMLARMVEELAALQKAFDEAPDIWVPEDVRTKEQQRDALKQLEDLSNRMDSLLMAKRDLLACRTIEEFKNL